MKTEATDSKNSEHPKPHASPAPNPLRLTILLSVLVVFAGSLVYDWVIAPPRVKAANEKLLETALKHNELSIKPDVKKDSEKATSDSEEIKTAGGLLYSEDIRKIIGMAPTKIEKTELYTIEHYCWWGWIPRKRNYITVLYVGNPEKPHYSTHYANAMPEDGEIPGRVKGGAQTEESSDEGTAPAGLPAAGMPGMGGPGMGGPPMPGVGGEKGKGKGRPQGKGDKKGDGPKETDAEVKKSVEGEKAEDPKKAEAGENKQEEPAKEAEKNSK